MDCSPIDEIIHWVTDHLPYLDVFSLCCTMHTLLFCTHQWYIYIYNTKNLIHIVYLLSIWAPQVTTTKLRKNYNQDIQKQKIFPQHGKKDILTINITNTKKLTSSPLAFLLAKYRHIPKLLLPFLPHKNPSTYTYYTAKNTE